MSVVTDAVLRAVPTFNIGTVTKAQNVYHMTHETGTTQDDDDVVAAMGEFIELLMGNFTTWIKDDVSMPTVECYVRESGVWQPLGTDISVWIGSNADQRVPSGACLLIKMFKERTGYADRKFLSGFVEGQINGDVWSANILSAADNFITDLIPVFTASNSVQLRAVHYNRVTTQVKQYTGGAGDATVAYQRRRKPGVGLT